MKSAYKIFPYFSVISDILRNIRCESGPRELIRMRSFRGDRTGHPNATYGKEIRGIYETLTIRKHEDLLRDVRSTHDLHLERIISIS